MDLTGWRARVGTSIVIVLGMACVTGVLASTLANRAGLIRMYDATGDASRVMIMAAKSPSEFNANILPSQVGTILNAPGLAKGSKGETLGDAEIRFRVLPPPGASWRPISVEGIGAEGIALRQNFRLVAGRMFEPGLHELLIGRSAQSVYGLKIGDPILMRGGNWTVVGIFSSGGDVMENGLVADALTVMSGEGISAFGSVLVKLERPSLFEPLKQWLITNPAMAVGAERQSDYYIRTAGQYLGYLNFFSFFVGAIISIGALLGSVNIFNAVVSSRSLEIATFRAIGYRALPVAASVVVEAVALALAGAVAGAGGAWLLFDGRQMVTGMGIYSMSVSAPVIALCAGWAVTLCLLGSAAPALRAARLPVSDALRSS
ncbi:MAG TPA: FtsX-like permease family protein [Steroidobacteraceae bacterium]|nr:FtsX-like permease family protein [Steroidobacteraceae bacterium]